METTPALIAAPPSDARRLRAALVLTGVGGVTTVIGLWLPLARLAGLGDVGAFDYNQPRARACLTAAILTMVLGGLRCFRGALVGTGVLSGLLLAMVLDLGRSVLELSQASGSGAAAQELAGMVHQAMAQSSLKAGSFVLLAGCAVSLTAGWLGTSARRSSFKP